MQWSGGENKLLKIINDNDLILLGDVNYCNRHPVEHSALRTDKIYENKDFSQVKVSE